MNVLCGECSSGMISLILMLFIFTLIYFYCDYKLKYWTRRGVPQLKTTNKFFGDFKNAVMFRSPPGYYLGNIYREAPPDAPFVGFYIFHKPCILMKDIEMIKQVLIQDFHNFSDRYFAGSGIKDSFGMINLFSLKTAAWRYLRRKVAPTFKNEKVKQMLPLMLETGEPMMCYLRKHVNSEDKTALLDVQDINYKYSADLIANVALGTKTDCFKNPNSGYCKFIMAFFGSFKRMVALITVFFMPVLLEWFGDLLLFDPSYASKIFWTAFKSREKSGQQRGDYIDSIIQLKNGEQDPVFKLEGENLMYQAGTFFSGFESGSMASTFTLMQLARNKSYRELARQDIRQAIEKHGWTIKAFNDMKYLDKCIAESLRLNPAVPMVDRLTLQDYQIRNTDVIIPKGTPIYISMNGLHGDPKYFEDPEVYNPDRFNDDRNISSAFIPYGEGPKKCIGIKTGQLLVKVVLSMILTEFEVYQDSTQVNKLDSRNTFTAAAGGILLEFKKLKQ